ncbi:ABC transporter substrate-binding protein [Romboutsia timonensis]|uniref:ABC transporter substrate-binding protein n=1 Tax=Romboutsia timonensis TaxID=1776391 RepID=UPI0023F70A56|nr:ABC transporter substrate-binding protein [Romboutsia timonensis]MCI6666689.1 ABC transporter substrate-binding protein [Romboutsia timonensis]MDY2881324.1 ABC transporter substrate-binding protein [Romboutsia timonensis]MDY3002712.1 ABC transporter substrate-binding protein [Romboutsia timonensis]MDY3960374.1 ABC transporter substrate-binding protein [Romboutsia timonensis]
MKKILALIMTLSIFVLSGCSSQTDRMVTDREGTEVNIPTKIEKIISTAPSNTEVLMALGLGDKLVAIDKYSTDIEGINTELPQIDFSNPDAETIIGLEPDIVIASGHNKTGSAEDPFKAISEAGIPVVYIPSSDSIDGIYKDIEFIADVVNEKSKGKEIVDDMKAQVEEIKAIGDTITDKKSVYFEISPAPYLSSFGKSTFLNEMIEIIGAKNIFENEEGWVSPTAEAIIDANPDVIITNAGYMENPTEEIKSRDAWENINAIKNNEVYLVDQNASSRPSQNVIKALEQMAKAVYPEHYEK